MVLGYNLDKRKFCLGAMEVLWLAARAANLLSAVCEGIPRRYFDEYRTRSTKGNFGSVFVARALSHVEKKAAELKSQKLSRTYRSPNERLSIECRYKMSQGS